MTPAEKLFPKKKHVSSVKHIKALENIKKSKKKDQNIKDLLANTSGGAKGSTLQYVAQFSYGPSFRTKRTLFDYFRRSFKSSSTEEFQK